MKTIRIVLGLLFCLTIYFLPTGIAIIRSRSNTVAILVLDLFLGWTGIGWVVALIWAVATDTPKSVVQQTPQQKI
ncbi:MAG: superinfection immunity protein [Candidatus Yonathbacteria bacterium]|nr:superinfection immunity protein [Candidatus Yonathbacteria bacterium]NTW47429.1 superinfection immunity protein [Candidatus Yonathbacteria bacterium]